MSLSRERLRKKNQNANEEEKALLAPEAKLKFLMSFFALEVARRRSRRSGGGKTIKKFR